MPAVLTDADMADLMNGTLHQMEPLRFQQIAQELQDYVVMRKWLKKDRVIFDHGVGIERYLMVKLANAAAHTGLMEEDQINIVDLLQKMQAPWCHAQTHWGMIRQDALKNRGKALKVRIIEPRRKGAMIDMAAELEDKAWDAPVASDARIPWGVLYWIVKNDTTGFTGDLPTGFTTVGGLVPGAYGEKWKNYSGLYTAVNKTGLLTAMRKMHRKTGWVSPVTIKDYRHGRASNYRYYMNSDTLDAWELMVEAQNDRLGRDLAPYDGESTLFRRHPIVYVPKLDADTANPIYQIDHSTFYMAILKGDHLRESDARPSPKQHNVYVVFVDLSYNYLCLDRRRNGVLYMA